MPKHKRGKSYYAKSAKKAKYSFGNLDVDLKGFLITCNNRERECLNEAYAILNEFADKLYGPEVQASTEKPCDDIEDELKREVENLKNKNAKQNRRFQALETKAKNCLFIKTTLEDPCRVVDEIMKVIIEEKKQKCRYILRMLPVLATCRSFLENIQKSSEDILEGYFKNANQRYSVLFKTRNNDSIRRDDVIQQIAGTIRRLGDENVADLKSPNLSVMVDVVGKFTFISVLKNYFQFKKYNLVELGSFEDKTKSTNTPAESKKEESEVAESKLEENLCIETTSKNLEETTDV